MPIKKISAYNGNSWGSEIPIGADDKNISITNAVLVPAERNANNKIISLHSWFNDENPDHADFHDTANSTHKNVAIANGDTVATAFTKVNRMRARLYKILTAMETTISSLLENLSTLRGEFDAEKTSTASTFDKIKNLFGIIESNNGNYSLPNTAKQIVNTDKYNITESDVGKILCYAVSNPCILNFPSSTQTLLQGGKEIGITRPYIDANIDGKPLYLNFQNVSGNKVRARINGVAQTIDTNQLLKIVNGWDMVVVQGLMASSASSTLIAVFGNVELVDATERNSNTVKTLLGETTN